MKNTKKKRVLALAVVGIVVAICYLLFYRGGKSFDLISGDYWVSPNGKYCVGSRLGIQKTVYLIDLQNMRAKVVSVGAVDPVNLTWGQDSQTIYTAIYDDNDKTTTFYSVNVVTASPRQELFKLKNEQAVDLSLSPDGRYLAFYDYLHGSVFCLYDTASRRLTTVSDYRSNFSGFSWSADGQDVVFTARNKMHEHGLLVYNTFTKKMKFIQSAKDNTENIAISPDGKSIAVTTTSYPSTVTVIRSDDGRIIRSVNYSTSVAGRVLWSQNSQSIYFVSHMGEQPQIERLDSVSGQQKTLVQPGNCSVANLIDIRSSALYYSTANDDSRIRLLSVTI